MDLRHVRFDDMANRMEFQRMNQVLIQHKSLYPNQMLLKKTKNKMENDQVIITVILMFETLGIDCKHKYVPIAPTRKKKLP